MERFQAFADAYPATEEEWEAWEEILDQLDVDKWLDYEQVESPVEWLYCFRLPGNVYAIYELLHDQQAMAFLIPGEERALLLDTCVGLLNIREVAESLTDLPITVLNSHDHFDHIGGNALFEEVWCYNDPAAIAHLTAGPSERELQEIRNRTKYVRVILDFQGRECHAACPEEGISPAPLIAQLILQLPEITAKVGEKGFAQTTLISVHVGEENFGISAGQGRLCLTIRAEKDQILQELESLIVSRAKAGARSAGLMMSLERRDIFPATVCDRQLSRQLEQVMTRAGIPCRYLPAPMRWSEDFGHYGSRTRAVFFGIGSGEDQPGLHTPDYVFPRELVKTGGRIWMQIIEHAL